MIEKNEKRLVYLLLIIFILLIGIILLVLGKYVFGFNNYEYKLPNDMIKKEVKEYFDNSYIKLSESEKLEYNNKLNQEDFIIPLNNAVNKFDAYNVNLLQSDNVKFIYASAKLKLRNEENIDFNMLKEEVKNTFNYDITDKFYNGVSNLNNDLKFCLKANSKKEKNSKLYLKLDFVLYDEDKCKVDNNDYAVNKYSLLVLKNDNNKYYIDSFKLIEKEG